MNDLVRLFRVLQHFTADHRLRHHGRHVRGGIRHRIHVRPGAQVDPVVVLHRKQTADAAIHVATANFVDGSMHAVGANCSRDEVEGGFGGLREVGGREDDGTGGSSGFHGRHDTVLRP